tara:strand:- start:551 stop:817 length:267 start_codon:yes stop_codon:yes gene_type:complete
MHSQTSDPIVLVTNKDIRIKTTVTDIYYFDEFIGMLNELEDKQKTNKEIIDITDKHIATYNKFKKLAESKVNQKQEQARKERAKYHVK